MIQKDSPLVTIQCLTYNHEPYIRQCLEGFVMQQTDFCFEVIVHDDASTDGTANIIREYAEKYPNIIKPILERENQWSKKDGSLERIMNEHTHGKYVAFCEGDDYWIDPYKLQKQVDFLETHSGYSMCFHKVAILCYIQSTSAWNQFTILDKDYNADEILKKWIVPTCSIVMKREVLNYPIKHIENKLNGDIFIVLSSATMGKVRGFSQIMGVYRVSESGVTYNGCLNRDRILKYPLHIECIRENFPSLSASIVNRKLALYYWERSKIRVTFGERNRDRIAAIKSHPLIIFLVLARPIKKILKKYIS